jgi:hypothetical protein
MFVERQQLGQGRRGTIINVGLKDDVKIQGQENYLNSTIVLFDRRIKVILLALYFNIILTISPPVNYLALTISPPTTVYPAC